MGLYICKRITASDNEIDFITCLRIKSITRYNNKLYELKSDHLSHSKNPNLVANLLTGSSP